MIKKVEIGKAFAAAGLEDPGGDVEWLNDYSAEAVHGFLKEWSSNEDLDEVPEAVEQAVQEAIWDAVSGSYYRRAIGSLIDAIEQLVEESEGAVKAPGSIDSIEEKKGDLLIDVRAPFLKIWRGEVEGQGYSGWGGDEKVNSLSVSGIIHILDGMAEVYGWHNIKRRYESDMEDFQPDTGSYGKLAKIADAALKESKK